MVAHIFTDTSNNAEKLSSALVRQGIGNTSRVNPSANVNVVSFTLTLEHSEKMAKVLKRYSKFILRIIKEQS